MNNETNTTTTTAGRLHPRLSFYHPTPKGTGCAMTLELYPACGEEDGCIRMAVANQMTIGNRMGPNPTFPRFDWENRIKVKLNFADLCAFLQVFRGECEAINGERGLVHRSQSGLTRIHLRHLVEPVVGYSLEIYKTPAGGGEDARAHILLNPAEALGLCEAIAGSMYLISFGIPTLVAQDATAYRRDAREVRDEAA